MKGAPIICGEPATILRLGPAPMKNENHWTQMDSDIIAHFLQVHGQIAKSCWAKSHVSFRMQGGVVLDSDCPRFEDFVFVAVYFRQVIAKRDNLLADAIERYQCFADCRVRTAWLAREEEQFFAIVDGEPFPFRLEKYSIRDVFDAFLYGAGLMHKAPALKNRHRAHFLDLYDKHPRERVLFALNASLRRLLNHVGNVAEVLYRDYAHWLREYSLPAPDVRWHDRLFRIEKGDRAAEDDDGGGDTGC